MKRRSFTHNYSYRGYFHITIGTARHLRQPLGRVCGDISAADGAPDAPHVELTPIGQMVQHELQESIPHYYPMLEVDTFVIMPEHLHILLHATRDIFSCSGKRTHLGRVIGGFKQGCNRRYWAMMGFIAESGKGSLVSETPGAIAAASPTALNDSVVEPSPSPIPPPTASSSHSSPSALTSPPPSATTPLPPLFEMGYCDVIPVDEAQLATQRAYIRNNPRSRLIRTANRAWLMPRRGGIDTAVSLSAMCGYLRRVCTSTQFTPETWRELRDRFLLLNTHITCDSYGNRSLLECRLLPVVCHRRNAARLATQKARCLKEAADGAILVSARIACGEQEIMDAALSAGFPIVLIEDNGFSDRYHPSTNKLDACADNRLLLVTPWRYLFRKKDDTIHVPFCKAMNCIAQALCRTKDDWWEYENTPN